MNYGHFAWKKDVYVRLYVKKQMRKPNNKKWLRMYEVNCKQHDTIWYDNFYWESKLLYWLFFSPLFFITLYGRCCYCFVLPLVHYSVASSPECFWSHQCICMHKIMHKLRLIHSQMNDVLCLAVFKWWNILKYRCCVAARKTNGVTIIYFRSPYVYAFKINIHQQ